MIKIIFGNYFQGVRETFKNIAKQLNPNLPFSPTLIPQKIHVEPSILGGLPKNQKKKPNLFD